MFSHPSTVGIMPEGLINTLFGTSINWVGISAQKRHWMFVVLLYVTWNALPFKILVFIGGLQNISNNIMMQQELTQHHLEEYLRK